MTVMVTGASGAVGHALVPLLVRRDEVRAAVREPASAEPLRALGAKVTVGRLDDAESLAEVLGGVFTLVHLVGGPDQPDDDALWEANHRSALRAVAAAREAGVRRLIFVSVPGAATDAPTGFLRAKGLAEEAVTTSGLQHVVIRSAPVVGAGSLWFAATVGGALQSPPVVWGPGDRPLAPVAVGDLAAVLAVADDIDAELAGTWALEGPDVVRADDVLHLLAGDDVAPQHLHGDDARERLSSVFGRPIGASVIDAITGQARDDSPDAAAFFGVQRTPLAEAMRSALAPAAASGATPGAGPG